MFIALHPFGLRLIKLGGEHEHQVGLRLAYFHSSLSLGCVLLETRRGRSIVFPLGTSIMSGW